MQPRKRQQLNLLIDDEIVEALEDIRGLMRPIPTVSDVVRAAILRERDRIRREVAKQGPEHAFRQLIGRPPSGRTATDNI